MNATERWISHFLDQMECVKCRSKENLRLLDTHYNEIDTSSTDYNTIDTEKIDVWCSLCKPQINMRVLSNGRKLHKKNAAEIATLKLHTDSDTAFDRYVIANHILVTKQDVVERYKEDHPCQVCGRIKHPYLMVFQYPNKAVYSIKRNETLSDVVREMQKCNLLCVECHIFDTYDIGQLYNKGQKVVLDHIFWSQFS